MDLDLCQHMSGPSVSQANYDFLNSAAEILYYYVLLCKYTEIYKMVAAACLYLCLKRKITPIKIGIFGSQIENKQ